ncbi:MAG TPA: hypothetical protein VEK76_10380 [Candidatus Binatia bacterium]|nr:hypothetical protein [Candidatus Binatia bacterium]
MKVGAIVAIVVGLILIGIAIYAWVGLPRARGYPAAGDIVVRCRKGHLFTTLWVPGVSIIAIRLGGSRYQRCPVGRHWSRVTPVNESEVAPEDLARAREVHDARLP